MASVCAAHLIRSLWIVGILVRMQFEGHLSVGFLDFISSGRLGQSEQLVKGVPRRSEVQQKKPAKMCQGYEEEEAENIKQ